jgi:hypothetical protein
MIECIRVAFHRTKPKLLLLAVASIEREERAISFDEKRWPPSSLTQSYRVHPTIWLVKTVKSRIVIPARYQKRFLLPRGDLSWLTFAPGYDAILPSARMRSAIRSMRFHPRSAARRDRLPPGVFLASGPCPARSAHSGKHHLNG